MKEAYLFAKEIKPFKGQIYGLVVILTLILQLFPYDTDVMYYLHSQIIEILYDS